MARTRKRVFDASARAVHIFVDSVITSETLATGSEVGTWRLVAEYKNGIDVGGTGRYRDLDSSRWDKWAGVGRTDARRNVADGPRN